MGGAGEGRGGGEDGAALVPGHQHVADVALAAGRARLRMRPERQRVIDFHRFIFLGGRWVRGRCSNAPGGRRR